MKSTLNKYLPLALLFALFITVLAAGCVTPATDQVSQQDITQNAADEVLSRLKQTTDDMRIAAQNIVNGSNNGVLDANITTQELANLYQRNDLACSIFVVDKDGQKVVATYPTNSVLGQGHLDRVAANGNPPLEDIGITPYMLDETGRKSIYTALKIKDGNEPLGTIFLGYDPYDLFGEIQKIVTEYGLNLVVIQSDGVQLYDPDVHELGTNLLTDEKYKEVLPTMQKVIAEKKGTEKYTFYEDKGTNKTEKTICWTTISYGGPDPFVMQNWTIATTAMPGMPNAAAPKAPSKTPEEVNKNLTKKEVAKLASDKILATLKQTTIDMNNAADKIVASSVNNTMDEHVTKQALADLYQENAIACQITASTDNGIVVASYPDNILINSSSNYGTPESMKKLIESVRYNDIVIVPCAKSMMGYYAIGSIIPIKKEGEVIGRITMNYDPYDLFGDVQQLVSKYGLNLVVVQKDGTQVYDVDFWELGTNILTDERFKQALPILKKVLDEDEGEESYTFIADGGNETVDKTVTWTTFTYGGQTFAVSVTEQ